MLQYKEKNEYINTGTYKAKLCKVVNCTTQVKGKDVCATHFKIINNICTSYCNEPALSDGSHKCSKHRGNPKLEISTIQRYKILPGGRKRLICIVKDCENCVQKKRMCDLHANARDCIVENCDQLSFGKCDFCDIHKHEYKKCTICNKILPLDDFYRFKSVDENVKECRTKHSQCIPCNRKKRKPKEKEYQLKNKEEIAKRTALYRKNNKEKIAKINKKSKKYKKENPIKRILGKAKRTDKYAGLICDLTEDHIKELLLNQNNKCYYCTYNLDLEVGESKLSQLSIDRMDSYINHIIGNCVMSCLFCNHAKNSATIKDYQNFISVLKDISKFDDIKQQYVDIKENPNMFYRMRSNAYYSDLDKFGTAQLISTKEIKDLLIKQDYKCAITGIPFMNLDISRFSFKMSLDRIDNSKDHSIDNCQLVCLAIQYGRNDKTVEEVKAYIEKIKAL